MNCWGVEEPRIEGIVHLKKRNWGGGGGGGGGVSGGKMWTNNPLMLKEH